MKPRFGYWLRLFSFFSATLCVALLGLPLLLGVVTAGGLVYAPCLDSTVTPAADVAWESVAISTHTGGFRGYFISGTNGATIIIPPTGAQGRAGRLPEAEMLARHGYAVLLYESRRCAGIGPISLGYREVADVTEALTYLSTREDVDPERIGIYGFSTAGATAVMSAAQEPQLKAVVAEGGYGDFLQNALRWEERGLLTTYFFTLHHFALRWTYRLLLGLDLTQLSPVSVIHQIAPRPILLVYGSEEVTLSGAYEQQAAAGSNAELWVVVGAGHGGYRSAAPEAYEARIVGFFDQMLKND